MLEELKQKVLEANLSLVKNKLVIYTWGNVSGIDRTSGLVVIKPSGVSYERMTADDMVVCDLTGKVIEGALSPSCDTPTHLEIYKAFPGVNGITHTHSTYATAWAQAGRDLPCYGTTQADNFYGDVLCTRALTKQEVDGEYEKNTGVAIIEKYGQTKTSPESVPAILVRNHGVFAFGSDAMKSVVNATVLEEVARMAFVTECLNGEAKRADSFVMDKHYFRKHGKNSSYGQSK